MTHDPKFCECCPWPLDCNSEEGVPKRDPILNDCPRSREVWEFRMSAAHVEITTGSSIATEEIEEEVLV